MSMAQDLAEAKDKVAEVSEQVTSLSDLISAKDAEIADLTDTNTALEGHYESEAEAVAEKHEAELSEAQGELIEARTKLSEAVEAQKALSASVEDLTTKLANPAFQAAGVDGRDEALDDDGGEPKAAESLIAEYNAITEPRKRSEFYRENEAAIMAECRANAAKE